MNREIIDSLFSLFNKGIPINIPGQVFRFPSNLFQRLIDWNGPNGNRRVANDPLSGFMNIFSGREIHDRIGSPANGPDHFFHFLFNC